MDPIETMTPEAMRAVLRNIREIVWPKADPDQQWEADTIEAVARAMDSTREIERMSPTGYAERARRLERAGDYVAAAADFRRAALASAGHNRRARYDAAAERCDASAAAPGPCIIDPTAAAGLGTDAADVVDVARAILRAERRNPGSWLPLDRAGAAEWLGVDDATMTAIADAIDVETTVVAAGARS